VPFKAMEFRCSTALAVAVASRPPSKLKFILLSEILALALLNSTTPRPPGAAGGGGMAAGFVPLLLTELREITAVAPVSS